MIFNPLSRITGYVVAQEVTQNPNVLFSLASILLGMILFIVGIQRKKESLQELIELGRRTPEELPST